MEHKNSHNENTHQNDAANTCPNCYKQFARNWCLLRHIEKCNGEKNKFHCEHCSKKFHHERSRFQHYKICSIKKEKDAKALIPVEDIDSTIAFPLDTTQPITNMINTQNNIGTVGTQNNIDIENQQNNNIIIVYNPGNTEFKTDHLKAEDLQKILQLATPYVDSRAMTEYSKKILSHPENRCIKKDDLKSGHSEVHIGDNEWELELDKTLYPRLASDMANNMSEFLHTKRDQLRREVFERLTKFVDYMADEGYINTEDLDRQKEIQREYKTFMKGLKLIVYGKTRTKNKD